MQAACSANRKKCHHLHFQKQDRILPLAFEGKDTWKGIWKIIIYCILRCEWSILVTRQNRNMPSPLAIRKYDALCTRPLEGE